MLMQRELERNETAHAGLTAARRLLVLGRDQDAADAFTAAGTIAGVDQAALYEGTAQAFRNLGRIGAALNMLDLGLERFPGHASLRFLRSLLLLGNGQFREGWPEYEMRLKIPTMRCYLPRAITWPRWKGPVKPRDGKILIWSEQGFGDEIMFASLIPFLFDEFEQTTFECSRDTAPLFRRSFPGVRVFPVELSGAMPEALHGEAFDYECPLGSLPLALNMETPPSPHAWLKTDPELTATLRAGLVDAAKGRRIVGVSWRGGTQMTRGVARSLTLPQFVPILDVPGILFVALQHDMTLAELQSVPNEILSWPHLVKQLDSLAALIGACDEIVTVCGTNVHLAGAMGKRVTVLAPHVPEWRYLFKGENMPWYRNVKVYRQLEYEKWEPVILQVARLLANHA